MKRNTRNVTVASTSQSRNSTIRQETPWQASEANLGSRKTKTTGRPGQHQRQYTLPVLFLYFISSFLITWTIRLIFRLSSEALPNLLQSSSVGIDDKQFFQSLPAQVFLTTFGWNHPNPLMASQVGRTKFQAQLNRGIEHHPWYNPMGWQNQLEYVSQHHQHQHQRFYIFFDLETCYEENFPNYGWGLAANSDRKNGRPYLASSGGQIRHMEGICPFLHQTLDSPLFQDHSHHQNTTTMLVLFHCGGNGPPSWSCLNRQRNPRLNMYQVSIVAESASYRDTYRSKFDMGLPPPAIHTVPLSSAQKAAILEEDCHNETTTESRPYLFSFTGNFRHPVRQQLLKLHNPNAGIIVQHHFGGSFNTTMIGRGVHEQFTNLNGSYTTLLQQTQFAGVPRGDNLFSYRFTEVLSGGCIPVVYADGWVLPFSKELIDWGTVAIFIPEQDASRTMEYLHNVTLQERCERRKKGYEFYQRYMASPEGVIAGIVESLERLQNQN